VTANPTTQRKQIDREAMGRDYRAGLMSLREIGAKHGCSHVRVLKIATDEGWERDLNAQIQAKAAALVTKRTVTAEVTEQRKIDERAVIEASAQAIASIRIAHRADIRRGRTLVITMLAELESQSSPEAREAFARLGEIMAEPDEYGRDKLNDAYRAAVSLPERIKGVKALSEALKNLVAMEREAWGLAAPEKPTEDPSNLSDDELDARIAAKLAKT
jgi:hypothetical protein